LKTLFKKARLFREKKTVDLLVHKGRFEKIAPSEKGLSLESVATELEEIDLRGALVLPGFVECHTHTVFGGHRGLEMEMKFQGRSYQDISRAGGGILSTVRATREASSSDLEEKTRRRIGKFLSQGVTTLEIKSGYGLDLATEVKMLESIPMDSPVDIVRTFLGAHAISPEFSSSAEYLRALSEDFLPEIKRKKLANRVDIFIEKGFFEKAESRLYLERAQNLGFELTIHADQLSLSGGTELACQLAARSADHCLQVGDREIEKLAQSSTVAVLLPAADLYLKCAYPPARKMLDRGVKVALATDFNPGTSPTQDLGLVGVLARREMGMTLDEVVEAYTLRAADALGISEDVGSIAQGKKADFTVWDREDDELFLEVGGVRPQKVFKAGKLVSGPG
jgi:imidazolonepropionase